MGKRKKPLLEKVEILDIGSEGKAIARVDDKVLFVPFGIPGDIVDIQVSSSRRKHFEGFITKYHRHSPQKTDAFCQHFTVCGGCKWQHLPYKEQLKHKQKQVIDSFERIGKLSGYSEMPIIPSEKTQYYRNKLEYTFTDARWLTKEELESGKEITERNGLGFHIPKKFDKVLDIKECYLQPSPSNEIRSEIRKFAVENNYTFFNIREQKGLLRNLIVRTTDLGETMVIVSFFYEDIEKRTLLLEHLKTKFPEIKALMYVVNSKANETLFDQDIKVYYGRDHIFEKLGDLKFKIGPKSFYQTNSKQAETLYSVARNMAQCRNNDLIFDLYCGTGTIALYMAKLYHKVIGIELIPEAIENANENALINNIENATFFAGDVKDLVSESFLKEHGTPETVIVDPPRNGLHPNVIDILINIKAKRIVYVSCNPATQARDLALLTNHYIIDEIQPVDMFPHTHHVENVAKLTIR